MGEVRMRVGAVLLASIAVTACGSSAVSKADIEKGVADQLEKQVGERPDVSCDGDLPAKEGAKLRCELKADDGTSIGATITATDVNGDDVKYGIKVDDA